MVREMAVTPGEGQRDLRKDVHEAEHMLWPDRECRHVFAQDALLWCRELPLKSSVLSSGDRNSHLEGSQRLELPVQLRQRPHESVIPS